MKKHEKTSVHETRSLSYFHPRIIKIPREYDIQPRNNHHQEIQSIPFAMYVSMRREVKPKRDVFQNKLYREDDCDDDVEES